MSKLIPYATWTNDCQGKQDYDGPIISISTRYWPGPEKGGTLLFSKIDSRVSVRTVPYGSQPSAHSSIILRFGPRMPDDGGGDYLIWKDQYFTATTESEVKDLVEAWAREQMSAIIHALGGDRAFSKP